MKTTYKKVFREFKIYKSRTLLALLGIMVGIFSVGFVLSTYAILLREMDSNFMDTNPASITINIRNLDKNGVALIRQSASNVDVEARKMIQARVNCGNGTYGTLYLFAVEDFSNLIVNTFTLEEGYFPQSMNEMALERDSLNNIPNLKNGYSETILVGLPGKTEQQLTLTARVHAPGLPPASMEKFSYGFLTLAGLQELGYEGWYDRVHIVSQDNRFDREALQTQAGELKLLLEQHGYIVDQMDVPVPGKHPHGDQLQSLLFLLQAFTIISLFVAGIIIVNLLSSIMSTQRKQIAIMKATGASTKDIAAPYFLYVLLLSVSAIIISAPLSVMASRGYSDFAANILNFVIASYNIPMWVWVVQCVAGIIIPIASAFYPIYRSSGMTVKDGLSEQVGGNTKINASRLQRLMSNSNSKLKIPINNILRKKSRTLLAMLALASGGLLFMTAQNIVASINSTAYSSIDSFCYNYDVKLAGVYADENIISALNGIGGVDKIEIYRSGSVIFANPQGMDSTRYAVKAIPENSQLLRPAFQNGQSPKAIENTIVINQGLHDEVSWLKQSMTVSLNTNGARSDMVVAGIVNEIPPIPRVYMSTSVFNSLFGDAYIQNVLLSLVEGNLQGQQRITKEIEERLSAAGIIVAENWNVGLQRISFVDHLKVIVSFLSVVALLAVAVGGMSIASAIGISVSERKREIGVLRAIGANTRSTVLMILSEVVWIGLFGWLLGLMLAFPVSVWAGNYFGQIFLHSDLNNTVSAYGMMIWLALSVTVSLASSFLPANSVAKAPLREILAYE